MSDLSPLLTGYSYFEAPRWHDGRLWLSDFYTHQVLACDLQGKVEKIADVPGQPSGLGWLPDGRLLVVSMRDRKLLRREADGRIHFSALSPLLYRLLDLVGANVDRRGGDLMRQLAGEAGQTDFDGFLAEARPMLQRLRDEGVLPGTRID